MITDDGSFDRWIDQAKIPPRLRSLKHLAVLQAAFVFLQQAGNDYASRRLVAHFLLHCQLGWKIAQVARLVGVTRPTASRQSQLSSRQVVREIQHRLSGRSYGKLLPRYAGPVAHFLVTHPDATRDELLDFIETTWNIRVSFTALHRFLNKYGLDRPCLNGDRLAERLSVAKDERALIQVSEQRPVSGLSLPRPSADFFLPVPSTQGPSC